MQVCDSGKIGAFYLKMHALTPGGDPELLAKAGAAGEWLLRIQQPDGDLTGSVFNSNTGNVTKPSNFAGGVCAVLLWAELYNATREDRWLTAAVHASEAIVSKWMQPGAYMFCGGELDDLFNPRGPCSDIGTTAAMYGAMAFASLALATEKGGPGRTDFDGGGDSTLAHSHAHAMAVNCTRVLADYMLAQQEVRDTNYGFYRRKARWMGADFKSSGGYQEWIRPETTYFMWRSFLATRDARYLQSMLRHAAWMQYKQWDEFDLSGSVDSLRTFGGSDESFQVGSDNLNGFGSNFWSETVGQGVALLEYYSMLINGEIDLRELDTLLS